VAIVMAFPRLAATAWDSVRSRWEIPDNGAAPRSALVRVRDEHPRLC
jgi:hypothetical protein